MPAEALKAIAGTLIIGCTGALVFYVRKIVNNYEENERAKKEWLLSNSAEKDQRDEEYMVLLKESIHLQQGMKQHLYWMDTRLHNMDQTTQKRGHAQHESNNSKHLSDGPMVSGA